MQKRYQGSHLFNDEQAAAFNELVRRGQDRRRRSATPTPTTRSGTSHQLMGDGKLPEGNVSCLVNAPTPGLTGPALGAPPSWTSSTSTPPIAFGCTNAIERVARPAAAAPRRSAGRPRRAGASSAAAMSSTRYATWCTPGPRVASEPSDRRVGAERAQQLDVGGAHREQDLLDPLVLDALAMDGRDAEQPLVVLRPPPRGPRRRSRRGRCRSARIIAVAPGPGCIARDQLARRDHVIRGQRPAPASPPRRPGRGGPPPALRPRRPGGASSTKNSHQLQELRERRRHRRPARTRRSSGGRRGIPSCRRRTRPIGSRPPGGGRAAARRSRCGRRR